MRTTRREANEAEHDVAGLALLNVALHMRQRSYRYLRRYFGYDVRYDCWLEGRAHCPLTPKEWSRFILHQQEYVTWNSACRFARHDAHRAHDAGEDPATATIEAICNAVERVPVIFCAHLANYHPVPQVRYAASLMLAGIASANLKLSPEWALYKALATEGDPYRAFFDRLPGTVLLAWNDRRRRPGNPLRETGSFIAVVGQLLRDEASLGLPSLESLPDVGRVPELEEFSAREEAGDPGTAIDDLLARAHLSPRQLEVISLRLQGRTPQEIADALGTKRQTVEVHLRRACERIRYVA